MFWWSMRKLRSANFIKRASGVHELGKSHANHPQTLPALTQALTDRDHYVRETAALALVKVGAPQVFDLLIGRLYDYDARDGILRALRELRDPRAVEPLIDVFESLDLDRPIGMKNWDHPDKRSIENTLDALDRHWRDKLNRGTAARLAALLAQTPLSDRALSDAEREANELPEAWWKTPESRSLVPALMTVVASQEARWALLLLARTGDPRALDLWLKEVAEGNDYPAANGLAEIGTPAMAPLLKLLRNNPGGAVIKAIQGVVEHIDDANALSPLVAMLDEPSMRDRAIESLSKRKAIVERLGKPTQLLTFLFYLGLRELELANAGVCGPWKVDGIMHFDNSAEHRLRTAIEELTAVLQTRGSDLTVDQLRMVMAIDSTYVRVRGYVASDGEEQRVVDSGLMRQLAREELLRRGA